VADAVFVSVQQPLDKRVLRSKIAGLSQDKIRSLLSERIAEFQRLVNGKSLRALQPSQFEIVLAVAKKHHACRNLDCDRFRFVNYYSALAYFDYLEDGFSFIRIV
jgi:hypothetical protein